MSQDKLTPPPDASRVRGVIKIARSHVHIYRGIICDEDVSDW